MLEPDLTNPCVRAELGRAHRYKVVSEAQVQEIEFKAGNGTSRRQRNFKAELAALDVQIARDEDECARLSGRFRRHAIIAG